MDICNEYIESSIKNNKVFSGEVLDEYINKIEEILDILKSVKNKSDTLTNACRIRNINYPKFRKVVPMLKNLDKNDGSFPPYEDFDINKYMSCEERVYSLVFGINPEDVDSLYSVIPVHNAENTIEVVCDLALTKKEKDILLMHCDGVILEDIGKKYGITIERVRHIFYKAVRKLRRPVFKNILLNGVSIDDVLNSSSMTIFHDDILNKIDEKFNDFYKNIYEKIKNKEENEKKL